MAWESRRMPVEFIWVMVCVRSHLPRICWVSPKSTAWALQISILQIFGLHPQMRHVSLTIFGSFAAWLSGSL